MLVTVVGKPAAAGELCGRFVPLITLWRSTQRCKGLEKTLFDVEGTDSFQIFCWRHAEWNQQERKQTSTASIPQPYKESHLDGFFRSDGKLH